MENHVQLESHNSYNTSCISLEIQELDSVKTHKKKNKNGRCQFSLIYLATKNPEIYPNNAVLTSCPRVQIMEVKPKVSIK